MELSVRTRRVVRPSFICPTSSQPVEMSDLWTYPRERQKQQVESWGPTGSFWTRVILTHRQTTGHCRVKQESWKISLNKYI